jgi:L-fucose mutarotase
VLVRRGTGHRRRAAGERLLADRSYPFSTRANPTAARVYLNLVPGVLDVPIETMSRYPFYDLARDQDTALVIATAERRIFANVMLRIGVRDPQR